VARLKTSVCELLRKESPEEGEKFEAAIGKIYFSVDLKSSGSALQLISARKKTDSYVGQFSEHRKTPEASKEVGAKPHWIRSGSNVDPQSLRWHDLGGDRIRPGEPHKRPSPWADHEDGQSGSFGVSNLTVLFAGLR
jgi:hypothetical protein